jgi:hypothetical protein
MGMRAPDGSLLFYSDRRDPPDNDMLGHVVVAGLATGEVVVKRLMRGPTPGTFDLESASGATRVGEVVEWAAHIVSIVPPYHAQKLIRRGSL